MGGSAESPHAQRTAQAADAAEALVVHQHDDDLDALLYGGDNLRRHHQVGAIADEDVDLAGGVGHLGAQAAGNLVAHAGVAVLHVVAVRCACAPQLVQVAGMAASGRENDIARTGGIPYRADDRALRWTSGGGQREQPVHFGLPL